MTEAATRQRFLIISNGHGEDAIASALARRLAEHVTVEAYPMIGAGKAFDGVCATVGPRAALASEGWRNVKGSLRRDIVHGGLLTIPPALKFLRSIKGRYDRLVVVGDMVGVLACLATGNRGITYLDVYKTGAARLYSGLEAKAIARACDLVFCRADNLAQLLVGHGVDARSSGNIMMDTIPRHDYDAASRRSRARAVTLLPGSRALTAESFALQIAGLRKLPTDLRPDIFMAVAGNVSVEDLGRSAGLQRSPMLSVESADLGELTDGDLTIHMARGIAMGNLLDTSDLVLSQAGTATVQALGLGVPAITFINPRDRRSRFEDEQNLFGAARTVISASADEIGAAVKGLLEDDAERTRLGAIGRERIGGPGAMDAILNAMLN